MLPRRLRRETPVSCRRVEPGYLRKRENWAAMACKQVGPRACTSSNHSIRPQNRSSAWFESRSRARREGVEVGSEPKGRGIFNL